MEEDHFILEEQQKHSAKELIEKGIRLFHGGSIDHPSTCTLFTVLGDVNHEQPEIFWFSADPVEASEYGDLHEIDLDLMKKLDIPIYSIEGAFDREYMIEADYCHDRFLKVKEDPFDI